LLNDLPGFLSQNLARSIKVQTTGKIWRWETGDVNVFTFFREFLRRPVLSEDQKKVASAVCGDDPQQFSTKYQEIDAMVGIKGGKNFLFEGITPFLLYKLSSLYNWHQYFRIPLDKILSITNSSCVNETQAKEVFFRNVKAVMKNTIDPKTGDNWFERYVGVKLTEGYGDLKKKLIELPNGLCCHSFDSTPDAPQGLLIFLGIIDEPSRANTPVKYANAKKLFDVVSSNALASFGLYSKTAIFSYPEQETNDLTVERYKASLTRKDIFGLKSPTWVFNPTITRESLQRKFNDDPIDAGCKYGCIVPKSRFGFFGPWFEKIRECANPTIQNRVRAKPVLVRRAGIVKGKPQILEFTGLEILDIQGDDKVRMFAGDPSISGDAFILSGGYAVPLRPEEMKIITISQENRQKFEEGESTTEDIEIKVSYRPIVDIILKWEPMKLRPVDYVGKFGVRGTINTLLKHFPNTKKFRFDRFQSESIRQDLITKGVECEMMSFSRPQQFKLYKILRGIIWNNLFECLDDEKGLVELEQLIKLGNKIDHPEHGSKDIADTWAMLVETLISEEYKPQMIMDFGIGSESAFTTMVKEYKQAVKVLRQKLGREPTLQEIAEHTGEEEDTAWMVRDYLNDIDLQNAELMTKIPGLRDEDMDVMEEIDVEGF